MPEFATSISLLREKFSIFEMGIDGPPLNAMGNRMVLWFPKQQYPLVVRCHSMYMTLRFVADLYKQASYVDHIDNMNTFFNFNDVWNKLTEPFELSYMPQTWASVYYKGRLIFEDNYHHYLFDVIEQCEFKNMGEVQDYQKSIEMTQKAFKTKGRNVMIEQESHVGFILDEGSNDKEMRFAIILRLPGQKATFVCRLYQNEDGKNLTVSEGMKLAADYIEGINMSVRVGFLDKTMRDNPRDVSYEDKSLKRKLEKRLNQLRLSIDLSESAFDIKYRPEKPDLDVIRKQCLDV